MKQHWLDIQSFLSDQRVLSAIDDLAIATKFELAGIEDAERRQLAETAQRTRSVPATARPGYHSGGLGHNHGHRSAFQGIARFLPVREK